MTFIGAACQEELPGAGQCTLAYRHEGSCLFPEISLDAMGSAGGPLMAEAAQRLERLLSHAEAIIVFAVARLDVLTYPGWPFEALFALGEHYKGLTDPGDEAQRKRELGLIWLDFAREAEIWEKARLKGIHKQLLQQDNLRSPAVSLLAHAVSVAPEKVSSSVPKRTEKVSSKKRKTAQRFGKVPKRLKKKAKK